ncbi:MAG: phosphoribosylamine--glycine ligase, partial [Oscillospiraceae bacterium]|nr:phosphoribosylamine--glycine ligase [Oscillospiraceae bacterium]
ACVIMASEGYPVKYEKGYPITLPEQGLIYVAGAAQKDGQLVTSGGRVLGVTAVADTLSQAIDDAYALVDTVHFDNAFYRHDIGARALMAKEAE